jgi:hypothetical protein
MGDAGTAYGKHTQIPSGDGQEECQRYTYETNSLEAGNCGHPKPAKDLATLTETTPGHFRGNMQGGIE